MDLQMAIQKFGYAALFGGALMEGETPLIVGGILSQRGLLLAGGVIIACATAAWSNDQGMYWLGRRGGGSWLASRPALRPVATHVCTWIERSPVKVVLGFRFLYGMRTVAPFLIGASGFPPARYMVLTAASGLAWALTYTTLGYVFGEAAERLLRGAGRVVEYAVPAVGVAVVAFLAGRALRHRRARATSEGAEVTPAEERAPAASSGGGARPWSGVQPSVHGKNLPRDVGGTW